MSPGVGGTSRVRLHHADRLSPPGAPKWDGPGLGYRDRHDNYRTAAGDRTARTPSAVSRETATGPAVLLIALAGAPAQLGT